MQIQITMKELQECDVEALCQAIELTQEELARYGLKHEPYEIDNITMEVTK